MQDMPFLNSPALKIKFASTHETLLSRDDSHPPLIYSVRTWLGRQLIAVGRSLTAASAKPLRAKAAPQTN